MSQAKLFDILPTGTAKKKERPGAHVDKEKADRRYYLHEQLGKFGEFIIDSKAWTVETTYQSFEDIPRGLRRFYVGQFMKLGYNIQYGIFKLK